MEENVPVRIPITKTKAKSLITPAPNTHRETAASNVVILVRMERESTLLIAIVMIFFKFVTGFISNSSRIRSNTTIVSLIEYPTIIRIEASIGAVNWPEQIVPSDKFPSNTNSPTVMRTS